MYCQNCGKEINDNAEFCIHCGVAIKNRKQNESNSSEILGIVGFILAFLFPVAGLICSIIANRTAKEEGRENNLATAGIAISIVMLALIILVIVILISYVSCLASGYFIK